MNSRHLLRMVSFRNCAVRSIAQCRRLSSDYTSEASAQLQANFANAMPEESLYYENQVRQELIEYRGGSVSLSTDDDTGHAVVTLTHEGSKNALTGQMMVELADHVDTLEKWTNGKVVTIKGANNTFCSGGHLRFVQQTATPVGGGKMSIFMQTVMSKLHRLPFLTIAYIEGHALGGGAEMSVACDWRVLQKDAKIGFVQRHLGLSCGWGGATHLNRVIHRRDALRLLASGDVLNAEQAKTVGLCDEIVGNSDDYDKYLQKYLTADLAALQAAKRTTLIAEESAYYESLNRERDVFTEVWGTKEHKDAVNKMIAKVMSNGKK